MTPPPPPRPIPPESRAFPSNKGEMRVTAMSVSWNDICGTYGLSLTIETHHISHPEDRIRELIEQADLIYFDDGLYPPIEYISIDSIERKPASSHLFTKPRTEIVVHVQGLVAVWKAYPDYTDSRYTDYVDW